MAWKWTVASVLAVAAAGALAACGSGGGAASGGGTGLEAALSRLADTSNNRSLITYDDTAALVKLSGNTLSATGYAPLIGNGVGSLIADASTVQSLAGINLLGEQYGISAGVPPATVGVVAGGQNAALVTRKLVGQGWKRQGQRLVMLPLNLNNELDGETTGLLSLVQPTGSDVVFGLPKGNLSQAGTPAGETLEQDPRISALASCLGNVVAADITNEDPFTTLKPSEVAAGVTTPASNAAVAHAVVCVAWPSSGTAARYTSALRQALATGSSQRTRERWSAMLRDASVTTIGGSQNVVQWQAQTPQGALTVLDMVDSADLPGLPSSRF
jgi:hypothetical protein